MKASSRASGARGGQHLPRAWSLHGQQGAIGELLDAVLRLERLAHVGEVGLAACGIDDHEQALVHAADDQVVEDAALRRW